MRANQDANQNKTLTTDAEGTSQPRRRPYKRPVIEKHPPMGNVTFGTNIMPMLAMTLAG